MFNNIKLKKRNLYFFKKKNVLKKKLIYFLYNFKQKYKKKLLIPKFFFKRYRFFLWYKRKQVMGFKHAKNLKKKRKFWFSLFFFNSFTYFLIIQNVLFTNTKKQKFYSTKANFVRNVKQYNFIQKEFYKEFNKVSNFVFRHFFPYSKYFNFFQLRKPFYRRIRRFKSRRFFSFLKFFTFRKYKVFSFKFFYLKFIESLCFKNFKLRHFFYKKIILKKFFKIILQINLTSLFNKILPTKPIFFIDSRLDFSLVRLNFYSTLYKARRAISEGLIFVNFRRFLSFKHYRLQEGSLIFSVQNDNIFNFLNKRQLIFHEFAFKKFFVFFKRRKLKFFKENYLSTFIKFFHKSLVLSSSSYLTYKFFGMSFNFFLAVLSFNYLNLFFFKRFYNLNLLNQKCFDLLVHNHF
ncbi:ribosomal protein S4 (mitochondrion) [Paulinella micropora]|uniref:Ribosomal protein S4 n=1 Tax=Paulinella micropora TaxID=1928728 RepID=A0A5K7VXG6_9EUKA|nr:ribosomal protein S4 [Paulinella micropora]BBL86707.1 ribosomal protein S4 [Paulinella micropora]